MNAKEFALAVATIIVGLIVYDKWVKSKIS